MIWIMAWRNIWRNKLRSIIIMLSVAIGLFAGIGVQSLYDGMMTSRVRNVIDEETGHIQLHNPGFKNDYEPRYVINNGNNLLTKIRNIEGVKFVSARSITTGMLSTPTGSAGVQVNGVLAEDEYKTSLLKQKIIAGKEFNDAAENEIMIGKKLADKMKLRPGLKLVLTFTDTTGEIVSSAFRVTAVYESSNTPLDERNVYVKQATLNNLLLCGNAFHEIVILLQNDYDTEKIQKQLQQQFPSLKIESWKELSPETEFMVKTVDQYSYIIMIIIMLALAFGIINTMLMAVLERTKEIGMMLALGTNRIRIFFLVLFETVFLTLAGTPVGLAISWIFISYFHKHGLDLSGMGKEMMSRFGFGTLIYLEFPFDKLAGVLLIVIGTALISFLFPALKALKLQPAEALRQ